MLSIDWKKGPDLPQGFQDSAFGIVHNALVTAGGFCQGSAGWANHKELDREKPGRYPHGFLNKAWSLDLAGSNNRWVRLPDFPAVARQGFFYTVADDQLYWCGGFNYSQPYCYRDGFRLKRDRGRWSWEALPPLPWAISCGGMNVLGSKIYLLGGADYDANKFHTNSDRAGNVKRLGALLTLDTKNLAAGWKELSPCPGTPRFCQAVAGVGGKLFVIGGAAGDDNPTQKYANVVDNWQYDPTADSWQRLRDMPVSSSNFPSGRIVAFDRYILLVGGYQYGCRHRSGRQTQTDLRQTLQALSQPRLLQRHLRLRREAGPIRYCDSLAAE